MAFNGGAMKKSYLLNAFLLGIVLATLLIAAGRKEIFVTKTYLNEGNKRQGIAIQISSTTWTQVLPQREIRRKAILQTLSGASEICLSTTTSGNCNSGMAGIHLTAGSTYNDYSEAPLYGRVIDNGSSSYIYGMEFYDTED